MNSNYQNNQQRMDYARYREEGHFLVVRRWRAR